MMAVSPDAFAASRERFQALCTMLGEEGTGELEHGELEARLSSDGRELLRLLLQDHLDLRAVREQRLPAVLDAQQVHTPQSRPAITALCTRSSAR